MPEPSPVRWFPSDNRPGEGLLRSLDKATLAFRIVATGS